MLGTIVNTGAILVGATCGSLLRKGVQQRYQHILFDALGLCCLVLGMSASLPNLAKSEYPVLFILSLAIGGLIGTKLDLSGRVDRISKNNKGAVQGIVTGSLLFCIGSFSIIGPCLSAMSPSEGWDINETANTFLYTNATLDLVTSAVLAASYGWIMLIAAPILFCWQGMFYLIAYFGSEAMPEPMRNELSLTGGVLILSSGLSILGIKDCKTINLLPSLLVPVIFYLIK